MKVKKVKKLTAEQRHVAELQRVRSQLSDWYKTQTLAENAIRKLDDERVSIIDKLGYVPYGL